MANKTEDVSIKLYRSHGRNLASRKTALMLAESVIEDVFGRDNLEKQLPLSIEDTEETWTINGSKEYNGRPDPNDQLDHGPIVLEILKANCQIVKLVEMASF